MECDGSAGCVKSSRLAGRVLSDATCARYDMGLICLG